MESLPEILQDKINLNIHELKFVDTLNVVKHLFDDDIELKPLEDDINTITPIEQSDIESEPSSETSINHASDIETEQYIFEYRQFICASPLINNISTINQTFQVTSNNKIIIDLTNDCEYCFDEMFSGVTSNCRPSKWKQNAKEFNITLNRKYYHGHIYRINIKYIITCI